MGRRVDQLAHSPTRSPPFHGSAFARFHSASDPTPYAHSPQGLKMESSPNTLEVPTFPSWGAPAGNAHPVGLAQGQGIRFNNNANNVNSSRSTPEQLGDGSALSQFLRRTTFMSASTDHTTGSFHRVLAGYSDNYVETVRRLVKRFTAPINGRHSISPISEAGIPAQLTWVDDEDAPPSFNERPFPLPGDFLSLDLHLLQQQCFVASEEHAKRWCSCYARDEISTAPWVLASGLTINGQRILSANITAADIAVRDPFDNTILHFLAARAPVEVLSRVLSSELCVSLLNVKNSAGQTFLHLANRAWTQNLNNLFHLLDFLSFKGFDIYARDHYGRNFFHMLHLEGVSANSMNLILQHYDCSLYSKRDAFDVTPVLQTVPEQMIQRSSTQSMVLDPPSFGILPMSNMEPISDPVAARESLYLQYVRFSQQNPILEDEDGRNGIQCLAMATLSWKSLLLKLGLSPQGAQERQPRRTQEPGNELDSSKGRLTLRLELLRGLLDAGVDPNQYDKLGNTPLMAFAAQLPEDDDYKTPPEILELLLDRGADLHARNRAGETALHIAVRRGRKLAMRTLVKHGANVHARDAAGRSALDVVDVKMTGSREEDTRPYAHYEACRAWLSGVGMAVQSPTVLQEWGAVSA